jgi:hypothetical protein
MRASLLVLVILLSLPLLALGCTDRSGGLDDDDGADDDDSGADDDDVVDDDDVADDDDVVDDDDVADDDDAVDDDDVADDDDAVDDDDDVQPDDDDGVDPGEAMVDVTYCLDWNTANITQPPGITGLLAMAGITLADYPLLLGPTSVAVAAGEIEMLGAGAVPQTCGQDTSMSTFDLTSGGPGTYGAPHFQVGPAEMVIPIPSVANLQIESATLEGDFTSDAGQIVDGTMVGFINVSNLDGACFLLTCVACPNGVGDCAAFSFDSATWNDNGLGPLTPVP